MENFKDFRLLLVYSLLFSSAYAIVNITVTGNQVKIWNDLVTFNFREDALIQTLFVNGTNIAAHGQKSFYLEWSTNGQHLFIPESTHIVEQTDSRVHFYWLEENTTAFNTELHYILEDEMSGIYCYVKFTNDKEVNRSVGLAGIVYRFENNILTQGINQVRTGKIPDRNDFVNATQVLDSTYLMPDGTYYAKYDWGVYTRRTNYHGLYGNGHGAFVICPSNEYHDNGAMKQTLSVHHLSLMLMGFSSNHYQIGHALIAPPGWQHIYGPFLLYFPTGESDEQIIDAAKQQVKIEQDKWPYKFVNETEYPLERGSVSGYINGQTNATVVVYDSLDEHYELQKLGYLFFADTDSKGYFYIDKVRPGKYRIVAYPLAGQGCESLAEDYVDISAGSESHVNLTLPEPENIIWSVGEVNRKASEFKYANEVRNYKYHFLPPEELNFTIGVSDPATDWYYAQTKMNSRWHIKYNDTYNKRPRMLRIALAGVTQQPHLSVQVNGHNIGHWLEGNDRAVYRCALQSGQYVYHMVTVKAQLIRDGENTIEFLLHRGQVMYDAISLQEL